MRANDLGHVESVRGSDYGDALGEARGRVVVAICVPLRCCVFNVAAR